jgi:hypothetical protein
MIPIPEDERKARRGRHGDGDLEDRGRLLSRDLGCQPREERLHAEKQRGEKRRPVQNLRQTATNEV